MSAGYLVGAPPCMHIKNTCGKGMEKVQYNRTARWWISPQTTQLIISTHRQSSPALCYAAMTLVPFLLVAFSAFAYGIVLEARVNCGRDVCIFFVL